MVLIIGYVRHNLAALELNLTSRPEWFAAKEMYGGQDLRGWGQMFWG